MAGEAMAGVRRLFHRPLARFLAATALLFATNLGLTVLLHELLGLSERLAFAIALATAFGLGFLLMRHFIYRAASGSLTRQFLLYAPSAAAFRGAEYLTFLLLSTFTSLDYRLLVVLVLGTTFISKFFYYGAAVFRSAPVGDSD